MSLLSLEFMFSSTRIAANWLYYCIKIVASLKIIRAWICFSFMNKIEQFVAANKI